VGQKGEDMKKRVASKTTFNQTFLAKTLEKKEAGRKGESRSLCRELCLHAGSSLNSAQGEKKYYFHNRGANDITCTTTKKGKEEHRMGQSSKFGAIFIEC